MKIINLNVESLVSLDFTSIYEYALLNHEISSAVNGQRLIIPMVLTFERWQHRESNAFNLFGHKNKKRIFFLKFHLLLTKHLETVRENPKDKKKFF